ncbi:MAG: extracellular solute-binding protein [Pseudomonadota bacterium]
MIVFPRLATVVVALGVPLVSVAHAQEPVELVVQYTQPQIFDGVFEKLKADFEAQNPGVTVTYRGVLPDYGAGIQALLRESLIGDMPDVTYVGISHIPTVANRELHVDLNTLAANDAATLDDGGWSPSIQSIGQVDGELIGLPHAISMPVVYYNADLVREVGGDPDNMPTDWEGFLELSGQIAALGEDYAGLYTPYSSTWYGAWGFQAVHFSHGGEMMAPGATTVDFANDPVWPTSLAIYDRMAEEGGLMPLGDQAQRQQFIAGRMGFVMDSISRLFNFEQAIGDRFELRTMPYPMAVQNGRLPTGGNAAVITTAAERDPAVLKAAWDFVKFTTGPYGTTKVIELVGYTPVNMLALGDPELLKGYFDDRPNHKTAVDQLPIVREWFQFPGENTLKIDAIIGDTLEAIVDDSMTPEEALTHLTEEVNALLPQD